MEKLKNYIGGKMLAPRSRSYFNNYEPAIGRPYSLVPDSDARDVQAAVEAAQSAFPAWSAMPAEERGAIMMRIAAIVRERLEPLARAESRDNGKPLWLARSVDIPRAATNFHFFGTAIQHFASEAHPMADGSVNYTLRKPLGVVGCISPWNLPLYLFTWKVAPALATGNCVVAKPSEITPKTAYLFADICRKAGLPPGVLNIVQGSGAGAGAAIVEHPEIEAISFTGGTATGQQIARTAAPMFKKLSLELGGKNPTIVFADCDYEKTIEETVRASFANQGEICLCGSRIYVERALYDRYRDDFVRRVKKLKPGDPAAKNSRQGALVSEAHLNKVLSYVDLARDEGGRILTGGKRARLRGRCKDGWFMQPTVIEGLDYSCRTNQEEIFGPVVTLQPFDSEEEALRYANGTVYGLAASVWTNDIKRAHRVADRLQSGIVWLNCWMLRDLRTPFGGMKDSGVGREGGLEALRFFTEPKNVCVKL